MNWEAIGAVGEIVGAAAVVVTLIYVAVQVRQNTRSIDESRELAVATAFDEHDRMFNEWYELLSSSRESAEVWYKGTHGDSLDAVDMNRYENFLNILFRTNQATYQRAKALGQEDLMELMLKLAADSTGYPHGEKIWREVAVPRARALGMTIYLESMEQRIAER